MTSGIYAFKHINKPFIYIGSSEDVEKRYNQHVYQFNSKSHYNLALQEDFLNGELEFEILAKNINKDLLLDFEQSYCVNFLEKGFALYNSRMPKSSDYSNFMICSKDSFKNDKDNLETDDNKTNYTYWEKEFRKLRNRWKNECRLPRLDECYKICYNKFNEPPTCDDCIGMYKDICNIFPSWDEIEEFNNEYYSQKGGF